MDTELAWSPNPKAIPAGAREFEANGKVYRKSDSVSAQRWLWLTKLQVEFSWGQTVEAQYASTKEAYELVNKVKFADAAVKLHDVMAGYANIANERAPTAARLAALFWNHKDENVGIMTEELMEEKWNDWMQEGIDMAFFFEQALSAVPALLSAYTSHRKGSSNEPTDGSTEQEKPSTDSNG